MAIFQRIGQHACPKHARNQGIAHEAKQAGGKRHTANGKQRFKQVHTIIS